MSGFIENNGQWHRGARYLARLDGLDVWITDSAIVYDFYRLYRTDDIRFVSGNFTAQPSGRRRGHVMAMRFGGSSYFWSIRSMMRRPGTHNYIGCSALPVVAGASLYDEIHISDITTGAMLRLYFENRMLRYDVILDSGCDPRQVHFSMEGASRLGMNGQGELALTTSLGDVLQRKLFAYQKRDGRREQVPCAFTILPGMHVGFDVGPYDRSRPLVIDPLVWSTFAGGSGYDRSTGLARAANGDLFITGYTSSANFPTTLGAYDAAFDTISAAFVTKLNRTGTQLLFSTYIGGVGGAWSMGITVDGAGCAHIAGSAGPGYPTTNGAYAPAPQAGLNAFATKLNASGSALIYSTCMGGSGADCAGAIAIDGAGRIYITGATSSSDFPTTSGAYDRSYGGGTDIFVVRISPSGMGESDLQYSTFIGGDSSDSGFSVTVDAVGTIYVVGSSASSGYPTTSGSFDQTHNGLADVVVSKIAPQGGGSGDLLYSTFIGGSGNEHGRGIDIDQSGALCVVGVVGSSNYPTTRGAFDSVYNGNNDAFCARLVTAATGQSDLFYSTYIGGGGVDAANGVVAMAGGDILIVGVSASSDFPTTLSAYDRTHNGDSDVVLLRIIPQGTEENDLVYSTFIGGADADEGVAIAADDPDSIYVSGSTSSSGFPATNGVHDISHNGGKDVLVALVAGTGGNEEEMEDRNQEEMEDGAPEFSGIPRVYPPCRGIPEIWYLSIIPDSRDCPRLPRRTNFAPQEPPNRIGDDARGRFPLRM